MQTFWVAPIKSPNKVMINFRTAGKLRSYSHKEHIYKGFGKKGSNYNGILLHTITEVNVVGYLIFFLYISLNFFHIFSFTQKFSIYVLCNDVYSTCASDKHQVDCPITSPIQTIPTNVTKQWNACLSYNRKWS